MRGIGVVEAAELKPPACFDGRFDSDTPLWFFVFHGG